MNGLRIRVRRDAIEAALLCRSMTKTELANVAGLHRTHLSDILAGRTRPGPRTRERLLRVLGGTFDDFFEIVQGTAEHMSKKKNPDVT